MITKQLVNGALKGNIATEMKSLVRTCQGQQVAFFKQPLAGLVGVNRFWSKAHCNPHTARFSPTNFNSRAERSTNHHPICHHDVMFNHITNTTTILIGA
jgi:hypothetical protein